MQGSILLLLSLISFCLSLENGLHCLVYNNDNLFGTFETVIVEELNIQNSFNNKVDRFSLRCFGNIIVDEAGEYKFITRADDGVRLFIDGDLVVNNWRTQAATERSSGSYNLAANTQVPFVVEYFEKTGAAVLQLKWEFNGRKEVIPASNFLLAPGGGISYSPGSMVLLEPLTNFRIKVSFNDRAGQALTVSASADTDAITFVGAEEQPNTAVFNNFKPEEQEIIFQVDRNELTSATITLTTSVDGEDYVLARIPVTNQIGRGCFAEFFNNRNVEGEPAATEYVDQIDFNYGSDGPPQLNRGNDFSIRFTCNIFTPLNEEYKFITKANDGVRLFIDGELVIDNWVTQSATEKETAEYTFSEGTQYQMVLEYFQASGSASIQLSWKSENAEKEIIPQENLLAPPFGGINVGYFDLILNQNNDDARRRSHRDIVVSLGDTYSLEVTWAEEITEAIVVAATSDDIETVLVDTPFLVFSPTQTVATLTISTAPEPKGTEANVELVVVSSGFIMGRIRVIRTEGRGLFVAYYNNRELEGEPVASDWVDYIDFDFDGNAPIEGVSGSLFSAQYNGGFIAPVSGSYLFHTLANDGTRLSVDGTIILNNWRTQSASLKTSSPINLVAGETYVFQLDYFQQNGGSSVQALWTLPGQNSPVVMPASAFVVSPCAVWDRNPVVFDEYEGPQQIFGRLTMSPPDGVLVRVKYINNFPDIIDISECEHHFIAGNWSIEQPIWILAKSTFHNSGVVKVWVDVKISSDDDDWDGMTKRIYIEKRSKPAKKCTSWGDPHITTLDGKQYNFQGKGDYYLVRSPNMVLQVRQVKCSSGGASCNHKLGIMYGDQILRLELNPGNGDVQITAVGNGQNIFEGWSYSSPNAKTHRFTLPDQTYIEVKVSYWSGAIAGVKNYLNIYSTLGAKYAERNLVGLCGDYDYEKETLSPNTNTWSEQWSVEEKDSLFEHDTVDIEKLEYQDFNDDVIIEWKTGITECECPPPNPPPPIPPPTPPGPTPTPTPTSTVSIIPYTPNSKCGCEEVFNHEDVLVLHDYLSPNGYINSCIFDVTENGYDLEVITDDLQPYIDDACDVIRGLGQELPDVCGCDSNCCCERGECTPGGCKCGPEYTGSDCCALKDKPIAGCCGELVDDKIVFLRGEHFNVEAHLNCRFDGQHCVPATVISSTQMECTIPEGVYVKKRQFEIFYSYTETDCENQRVVKNPEGEKCQDTCPWDHSEPDCAVFGLPGVNRPNSGCPKA